MNKIPVLRNAGGMIHANWFTSGKPPPLQYGHAHCHEAWRENKEYVVHGCIASDFLDLNGFVLSVAASAAPTQRITTA
jgi:hypothetical protein